MKNTKLTYFLRGLGFGIVFVTVIMTVSVNKKENKKVVTTKEMSKDEIIAKAKEYGMVEGVGMKVDQLMDAATPTPVPTAIPKEEAQSKPQETTEAVTNTPTPTSKGEKSFTIQSGQSSEQITSALESAGLVDDAKKFQKFLNDNGYSTKIIASKHTIPLNASYETVAKRLCEYE